MIYILILVALFSVISFLMKGIERETPKFSDIVGYFEDGKVTEFFVDKSGNLTLKLDDETVVTYRIAYLDMFYEPIE